jgi:hypothetical protein
LAVISNQGEKARKTSFWEKEAKTFATLARAVGHRARQ